MINERVTGLYFNETIHSVWIMYTELYPERIDNIDKAQYMGLLTQLSKTNGTRYDLYQLLLLKRQAKPRLFNIPKNSALE
ncbi:hypothetical protein L2719_17555 [Shewanella schlegeliana]|uniref:Uncharacterized protein n=1 Tax=Shewanella schlegeliana TaxID=190308 RepID=A0ABS1SU47_9GAMM|nr:hypothetical protein [Shewanella schlegeliana]MBL4912063.1 hypothetical protein [Shewanella schlegeliana]MCL1111340.1 hypothetical protein [Shewanella schlegeliana]GIU33081.1 hypothetical protein TUM4433_26940 [Shewanella schlegeliana]